MNWRRAAGRLALVIATAACGSSSPAVTTPTPLPPTITSNFSGTLAVMGQTSHNFLVTAPGRVLITLTSLGPPSVPVGVGLGVPSGLSCVLSLGSGSTVTTEAGASPQISGTALAGTFCVEIYDVGNLTAPAAYTITVNHS